MANAELVFFPSTGVGHIVSTVEIAKLIVKRDHRLSVTVLIMKSTIDDKTTSYVQKLRASSSISDRIKFVELPEMVQDNKSSTDLFSMVSLIESQKPHVKKALAELSSDQSPNNSPRLAGFVIDMFCTAMIDVADELGVPTYLYYTSSAKFLSVIFELQILHDEQGKDLMELGRSDAEFPVPGLRKQVPARLLPISTILNKEVEEIMMQFTRDYRRIKGIMVNTFMELESDAVRDVCSGGTPIYPVGPVLNINGDDKGRDERSVIIKWLDDQPSSSVVFLCFGSMGSFDENQIKEIAVALENSGHRFLWSLRHSPLKGQFAPPIDYVNLVDVLPEGFLDRTSKIGKLIGWAPQVEVLAHPAIGLFVSHCGWNSILESIWFGVPIATWPLYAEQQFNAFCLLKEFLLSEEIKMDYKMSFMGKETDLVMAEVIEEGIRKVMEMDVEKKRKVKEMSEKSRKAMEIDGSSYVYLGKFIDDVFSNML